MAFAQADDDSTVEAALIIALVVTAPAEQLVLLRRLFSQLQHPEFLTALLGAPEEELASLFQRQIFTSSTESLSKTEHSGALS
ncbi:PTS system galactitol-specific transporter subunit IIA [compost metagenome]